MNTVAETILSYPGLADFPQGYLETILKARSLTGASDVGIVEVAKINLAIADTLAAAVNMPDFTENKLSVKYKDKNMLNAAIRLYRTNGEPEKANELIRSNTSFPTAKAPKRW